jgi:hypothetical protein
MCGIFGIVLTRDDGITPDLARSLVERLFLCSESRGREAAGLAVFNGTTIDVLKQAGSASDFVRTAKYGELMDRAVARLEPGERSAGAVAICGHSRLVTNGLQSAPENNQPVVASGVVGIHNGIIVNEGELWRRHGDLERVSEVDTEVLLKLLRKHFDRSKDVVEATRATFGEIFGAASVAVYLADLENLLLATNTGSLFVAANARKTFLAFASERYILRQLTRSRGFEAAIGQVGIEQVRAETGLLVSLRDMSRANFNSLATAPWPTRLAQGSGNGSAHGHDGAAVRSAVAPLAKPLAIIDHTRTPRDLRRCTRCILPETYPFMDFDSNGLCRYCRNWRKIEVKGEEALLRAVEPYRSKDGSPDVIVAFSGGRDSTYGLHYVKQKLGMNPVAFTYDWGMVTDLARRNQARICGKLGVEHILRSADIAKKRRFIRKNIEAWLKRPELGMVTLFTAGDKEFYQHARALRKETGIKLVIFCTGNMIEDTPYKTGLCGIREGDHGMTLTGLPFKNEIALVWYYLKQYLLNPRYFNESFGDTLNAYWQTFVVKDDFLYLYHYLKWDEQEIVGTIRREYDWEVATDTSSTWRIGDWTAAWYNYIYQTIAGWTEDEVMLSNMIREGIHERGKALKLAAEYGKPRIPTIREYAQAVGFNCEEALNIINATKKLF